MEPLFWLQVAQAQRSCTRAACCARAHCWGQSKCFAFPGVVLTLCNLCSMKTHRGEVPQRMQVSCPGLEHSKHKHCPVFPEEVHFLHTEQELQCDHAAGADSHEKSISEVQLALGSHLSHSKVLWFTLQWPMKAPPIILEWQAAERLRTRSTTTQCLTLLSCSLPVFQC